MNENKRTKEKCITLIFFVMIIFYVISIPLNMYDNKERVLRNTDLSFNHPITTIKAVKSQLELYSTEELQFRNMFVRVNGYFSKVLDRNYFTRPSNIAKLDNGHLTYLAKDNSKNMRKIADKVLDYQAYNANLGIDTIFALAPYKLQEGNEQLPNGVVDYSNTTSNQLLSYLREGDMSVLDYREELQNDNMVHYDSFYLSDQHWTLDTSLWASRVLAERLNQDQNLDIDTSLLDRQNFKADIHKKEMLGSIGRLLGLGYTSPEDFEYVLPKEETNLHLQIKSAKIDKTGAFDEVMFDPLNQLKGDDFYLQNSHYGSLLYGLRDETIIQNYNLKNKKRILMIGDSFSRPVAGYLSLATEHLVLLDLRYFKGSVEQYTKDFDPDAVVLVFNPSLLANRRDGLQNASFK